MALTVTSRGTGTHNTGATTLVPGGRSATLAVGSLGVFAIALDNAGSAGASTIAPASWTDAKGNVWTRQVSALYDNGAASAGIEMALYTAPITVALLTTDAGTITWSPAASPVAKAWTWYEAIPSVGFSAEYDTGGSIAGATAANAQVVTATIQVGSAVIAGYFSENVGAVTGDSDTTNGTWTAQQTATIGATTGGVRIATQQKVQTTTASTQSYDVTVASQDRIAGYIALKEVSLNKTFTIPVATLAITSYAPTWTPGDNKLYEIPAASLAITSYAPAWTTGPPFDFVCGFEDATDYAAHWNDGGTGPHALDSTVAGRNGDYALRIDAINDTTYLLASAAFTARAVTVLRFRFRTSALPTATTMRVMKFNGVSVYDPYMFIDNTDNRLYFSNGGTNAQGPILAADTWYTIQVAVDGANRLGRWSVDGTAQPDPGAAGSNDTHNAVYFGKTDALANGVHSMYYDDVAFGRSWGSYPFGDGSVDVSDAWVPTAPGSVFTIPAASLAITSYAPTLTITDHKTFTVPAASLTVTAYAPTVRTPQLLTIPAATLAVTSYAPTWTTSNHKVFTVPAATLAIASYAPTWAASDHKTFTVPAATLAITSYAPTWITTDPKLFTIPAATLAITSYAPTVLLPIRATVPAASLAITSYAPTWAATDHKTFTVPAATLTITSYAPTWSGGNNRVFTVPAASLAITSYAPTFITTDPKLFTIPAATLAITSYAPTVLLPKVFTVPVKTLAITSYAPTVRLPKVFTVPAATLTITSLAPVLTISDHRAFTVPAAALAITTYAPAWSTNAVALFTIPPASLEITTYAPTVIAVAPVLVTPGLASLTVTTYAPVVTALHLLASRPRGVLLVRGVLLAPPVEQGRKTGAVVGSGARAGSVARVTKTGVLVVRNTKNASIIRY